MRLILIRHGHTASNEGDDARLSGRTEVPLSARGVAQVVRLSERLAALAPFAAIYSSPLQRAWQTALPLVEAGLGPLHACPGLQEIDCGTLDGMPLADVARSHPDLWAANNRQDDERFRWPGGESYREFRCRCLCAVRAIVHAERGGSDGAPVAVVTHAGVISQIVGALRGTSPARWEMFRPGNTALTEIEWARGTRRVLTFDDRIHLDIASA